VVHLTERKIQQFMRNDLPVAETTEVARHIGACDRCAALARRVAGEGSSDALLAAFAGVDEHPELDDIFHYVDGSLDPVSSREVALHLERCTVCFDDYADARKMRAAVRRSSSSLPAYWRYAAAILLGVLSVVWFVTRHTSLGAGYHPAIQSIGVMPLLNESVSGADDFLQIALSDAVTTKLQQIPSLVVPPMSAILNFERESHSIPVDLLVGGHYVVKDELLHVTIELTDAHSRQRYWSQTIVGRRDNLGKIVDDLSGQTLKEIAARFGLRASIRASVPSSTDGQAFEEYLKARSLQNSVMPADSTKRVGFLRSAIARDARFAAAYADLALELALRTPRGTARPDDENPEVLARTALDLDPALPVAHLAMARAIIRDPKRLNQGLREAALAVRLNPKETRAISLFGVAFSANGDAEKTVVAARYLKRLDPLSIDARAVGYWYLSELRPHDALHAARSALANPRTELAGDDIAAQASILVGDLATAERYADRAASIAPGNFTGDSLKAMVFAARGDHAACLAALQRFESEAERNHYAATRQMLCYARLGDRDRAVAWLRKSSVSGNYAWFLLVRHPWLQSLQHDPEFAAITRAIRTNVQQCDPDFEAVYQLIRENES